MVDVQEYPVILKAHSPDMEIRLFGSKRDLTIRVKKHNGCRILFVIELRFILLHLKGQIRISLRSIFHCLLKCFAVHHILHLHLKPHRVVATHSLAAVNMQ